MNLKALWQKHFAGKRLWFGAPKKEPLPLLTGVASPYDPDLIEWYDEQGDLIRITHVRDLLR